MSQLNLQNLAAEKATEDEAIEVPIRDLSGEAYVNAKGAVVTMKVLGEHSEAVRAATLENQRRASKLRLRGESIPADFWAENLVRRAFAALVAWGMEDMAGNPVPLTLDNVREVFKAGPWIQEQVEAVIQGHAAFFAAKSKG